MEGCADVLLILLMFVGFGLYAYFFNSANREPPPPPRRPWVGPSPNRARGDVLGFPYEIHEDAIFTRVIVDVRGRSPGKLKIAPPGTARKIARMFGTQDLRIGDEAFDDRFIVMSNPESLARRIFLPERRARLIAAVLRIGKTGAPFIDLTAEKLIVGVVGGSPLDRPGDLLLAAREFTEVLREIASVTSIVWIDHAPAAGGQCQVCGTEMTERVVHCSRCRTPHHEECWEYAGECSTFACKETTYLKDGRPVRAPALRQTPDESERGCRPSDGLSARIGTLPQVAEALRRFERRQRERRR